MYWSLFLLGYKVTGSTERRKGRKSTTATTEENVPIFEELVSSQKDEPDTLNSLLVQEKESSLL